MTNLNPGRIKCGLCGEVALGSATADGQRLCHATERSCYHRWTVYSERREPITTPDQFTAEIQKLRDRLKVKS